MICEERLNKVGVRLSFIYNFLTQYFTIFVKLAAVDEIKTNFTLKQIQFNIKY